MRELKKAIRKSLSTLEEADFLRLRRCVATEIVKEFFNLEVEHSDINPYRSFASFIDSPEHLSRLINADRSCWNAVLTEVIYELEFYQQQVRKYAAIKDPNDKPGVKQVRIKSLDYSMLRLPEMYLLKG